MGDTTALPFGWEPNTGEEDWGGCSLGIDKKEEGWPRGGRKLILNARRGLHSGGTSAQKKKKRNIKRKKVVHEKGK